MADQIVAYFVLEALGLDVFRIQHTSLRIHTTQVGLAMVETGCGGLSMAWSNCLPVCLSACLSVQLLLQCLFVSSFQTLSISLLQEEY